MTHARHLLRLLLLVTVFHVWVKLLDNFVCLKVNRRIQKNIHEKLQ